MTIFSNSTSLFLSFILLTGLVGVTPVKSNAQDFQEGLKLYEEGRYTEAALIFEKIESSKARLFEGKSYFGSGQYLKAKNALATIPDTAATAVQHEAVYTEALSDFQMKLFGEALKKLHTLSQADIQTPLITQSSRFYNDILDYLTLNQRKEAFQTVTDPRLRYDIIRTALGKVTFATAKLLVREYKNISSDSISREMMRKLEETVSDSMNYAMEIAFGNRLEAPDGITYDIGAALPRYSAGNPNFEVSQGLYFGYVLAAEQFNQRHNDKKAFIRYKDTGADKDSSEYLMTDFAWNYEVDAVLGPLFSEPAIQMARLAELYEIPMLAPLANSDTLNFDNPYLYQANPPFASHGKKMAQYAVKKLKMDTLAVLAERNSLGEASAFAFRREAEKLGAKVAYFFLEDLESKGYEITDYTRYFTGDSTLADSLGYTRIDGLYAPFTGQVAPTLIDLLLIDLNAKNSDVTVLGSQEWGATEIPEDRLENRTIYFSESYYINTASERVKQFKQDYKKRFGVEANKFSMIGFDAASYLLNTLERVKNPALLKNALSQQPLYEGLISNIKFEGKHVNQEVKIFKLSKQGIIPTVTDN